MPNVKLVNIRFRLDADERDKKIHDALFKHPDGARNNIIKTALYAYLLGGTEISTAETINSTSVSAKEPNGQSLKKSQKNAPDRQGDGEKAATLNDKEPSSGDGKQESEMKNKPCPSGQVTDSSGADDNVFAGYRSLFL